MRRFYASAMAAGLVGMAASDAGVPLWRDWQPGDIADLMLTAFLFVWFSISALRDRQGPTQ